jgi:hypothetical protein
MVMIWASYGLAELVSVEALERFLDDLIPDFGGVSEDVLLTEQQHRLHQRGDGLAVMVALGDAAQQDGDDVLADGVQPLAPWAGRQVQVSHGFSLMACR